MSPGRKPSRSPASTAGRVRMIRPTCLSGERRDRERHREVRLAGAGRADPEGDRALADRVDVALLRRPSSARSSCRGGARRRPRRPRGCPPPGRARATTASTVSGPISCPPSTSSTSSSTTARASATRSSSPSIVSWLPRRRSVQCSRSRSESSTPSPMPAELGGDFVRDGEHFLHAAQCRRGAAVSRPARRSSYAARHPRARFSSSYDRTGEEVDACGPPRGTGDALEVHRARPLRRASRARAGSRPSRRRAPRPAASRRPSRGRGRACSSRRPRRSRRR